MIKNNYVQVEPVKKKVVLRQMTFEDLKEEDLVYGVVSKIDSDDVSERADLKSQSCLC